MQGNGYVGNTKTLIIKIRYRKKRPPLKDLMAVSYLAAIGRKRFTVFWACQSDVELKEKKYCVGNVKEELKTSQMMWYDPDSLFKT